MGFPREVPWLLRPRAQQPRLKKPPLPLQRRRKRKRRRTSPVPSLGPTTTWDSVSSIKNASLPRRDGKHSDIRNSPRLEGIGLEKTNVRQMRERTVAEVFF